MISKAVKPRKSSNTPSMDWFSWLSKTTLEPSLVYEYGLAFAHNELEEEDIPYLNHEFLQSMGISIAKHRLEIIKLAKKESGGGPHSIWRLLAIIKKTKCNLLKRVRSLTNCSEESAALIVVPRKGGRNRWKVALLRSNRKLMLLKQARFLLTDGRSSTPATKAPIYPPAPAVYHFQLDEKGDGDDPWKGYTPQFGVEQMRWASLFQDLKPI